VIDDYSDIGIPSGHNYIVFCTECPNFDSGKCPDIMYYGETRNRYGETRVARHHLRCINSRIRQAIIHEPDRYKEQLVAYYPLVEGLEKFQEE